MIRMMCGWVRLVDRMSTDVLCDRGGGGVVVKIEVMII